MHPREHLIGTGTFLTPGGEFLGDLLKLTGDVRILLLLAHCEVVLLLQTYDHVTEVVPDEVRQEAVDRVGFTDVVLLHNLIGEISACFERKTLRLAKRIVTVQEDVFDLQIE